MVEVPVTNMPVHNVEIPEAAIEAYCGNLAVLACKMAYAFRDGETQMLGHWAEHVIDLIETDPKIIKDRWVKRPLGEGV
jgi:hypothetical protein